ncbi:hypothetical protein DASC09_025670 [Saccharomycopsis crataegensis]|uniref:Cleavage/polyadenylation specificity factor A subunit N-terminal domain-containing protein n=1 Tax=Saccharomycopsis crataegensis TaxID=43959 RepID=A0AAV5QL14_9ASCO|nr:hypothetical protein DASC09_025670 [Saccharomycopsis crataegensis]
MISDTSNYEAVLKNQLIHSPIVKYLFDINVSINKQHISHHHRTEDFSPNFSIFDKTIRNDLCSSDQSQFSSDTFGSNDTLDEILAQDELPPTTINDPPYIPKLQLVKVLVRDTSLLIESNIFPISGTIRCAAVLPGITDSKGYHHEDSLLLTLSSGYLVLIRLILTKHHFQPFIHMWHKISDPATMVINSRLGYNITCHDSGCYFAVNALENYIAIFECYHDDKITQGSYFKKHQVIKVDGTILYCGFFKNLIKTTSQFRLYSLILTDERRLQIKSFSWIDDTTSKDSSDADQHRKIPITRHTINRHTLPLFNDIDIPCLAIALHRSQSVLFLTKSQFIITTYDQIHSGATELLKAPYSGGFPLNYYQPKSPILSKTCEDYNEVLISSANGVIYLVVIIGNQTVDTTPLVRVRPNCCLSAFSLERVDNHTSLDGAEFIFTYGDEKSNGYCQKVRLVQNPDNPEFREFRVLEVYDKYWNWCTVFDFECIDHSKNKSLHGSQELWMCSGEARNGSILHMRYGVLSKQKKIHNVFKKATKVFTIPFATDDREYNYYFLANFPTTSKLFTYNETENEFFEVPITTAIEMTSETLLIEKLAAAEAFIQVTRDFISIGNINETLIKVDYENKQAVFAELFNNWLFYIVMDNDLEVQLKCKKIQPSFSDAILINGSTIILDTTPTCVKVFEFDGIIYLVTGSMFGDLRFFNLEPSGGLLEEAQTLKIDQYYESAIHDMLFIPNQDHSRVHFYVTDQFGSLLSGILAPNDDEEEKEEIDYDMMIDSPFFKILGQVYTLHFGTLPIKLMMSDDSRYIYLISKHLWRLETLKEPGLSAPATVFFEDTAQERNVFAISSLIFDGGIKRIGILREDGYCIAKFSETLSPVPKQFHLGFTPNKFMYIPYLHVFCIISNDMTYSSNNNKISFFDVKSFKKVRAREISKHNKQLIFNNNERLLSIGEWYIKKKTSSKKEASVYKNVVVGCQLNNDEGSVHVIELKKEKNERDLIKVGNLYTWRTNGPVFAVQQLRNANTLVYSSGNTLYTRKYICDRKSIDPPKKQYICGSLIVGITIKDSSTIIVSTRSTSVSVFEYNRKTGELVNVYNDSVSKSLLNSIGVNDFMVISDKLHSTITGFKVDKAGDFAPKFKDTVGGVVRLKNCELVPIWVNDVYYDIVKQHNRFLGCGIGGQVFIYFLCSMEQFDLIKHGSRKAWINGTELANKGKWETDEIDALGSEKNNNVLRFDLNWVSKRSDSSIFQDSPLSVAL